MDIFRIALMPEHWEGVFLLETPLLELIVRGSLLYFGILIFMRLMPRRSGGDLATMDLIFVVLIANSAANALGDYTSVMDGFVLILVLMGWDWAVNFLSYRIAFVERLISSPPLPIVRDGELLYRNLRREYITEEELLSHLRQQGIERVEDVKAAYVEGQGRITAIARADGGKT